MLFMSTTRTRSGSPIFSANAIVRFDPLTEKFNVFASDKPGANVRQLNGRAGETWGGESGTDRLVVIQTATPA
jgi:Streptogramin lyase